MTDAADRIQDDLNVITDRISNTVRSVSLGVLALAWLFIAGSKDASGLISLTGYRWQLLAIAAISIFALLLDLAQYFCGYQCSLKALHEEEDEDEEEDLKPKPRKAKSPPRKAYDFTEAYHLGRRAFFWAKQVAAGIATFWMLGLIFVGVLSSPTSRVEKKSVALEVRELTQLLKAEGSPPKVNVVAGRYQLFQGWYRFVNLEGEESRTETLFKIDTATGDVFECSSVQFAQDGKGTQKTACLPFEGDLSLGPVPAQK